MTRVAVGSALYALAHRRATSRSAVQARQDVAVRRLVRHAAQHVPYYRELFASAGVTAADIRTASDLRHVPISAKSDLLRAADSERVAAGVPSARLLSACSSGTTGEPFTVLRSWTEQTVQHLFTVHALGSLGVGLTDRTAAIHYIANRTEPGRRRARRLLGAIGLGRTLHLDVRRDPADLADALLQYRPDVLAGYPAILDQISQVLADRGVRLAPRLVVTGAEVLQPKLRTALADRFGAPVHSLYGSIECQLIASQCPEGEGFHLCDGNVVLEVLRRDGTPALPGELGEAVVTVLTAYTMPFIRYRLGDLVVAGGKCPCGGPWHTVRQIHGRTMDYLRLPGGRRLHPFEVTDRVVWDHPGWARRFQLTQERENRIVLRAVAARRPGEATLRSIRTSVGNVLGPNVEFALELVDDLAQEPSGKFRLIRPLADAQ